MPSGGSNKFTYEQVKEVFEKHGFHLLENEYRSNNTPMKAKCPCGDEIMIRLSAVKEGRRCQKCKAAKRSKELKMTDDGLKVFCEEHGHQFVKSWIENRKTRIEYVCKCGTTAQAYWSNFRRYPNCKKCGAKKISGENCYMYDPDREAVAMRKKFRKRCDQYIRRFMKATGQRKTRSTHELLGYTPQELQAHILGHPDMKLCEGQEWHVDHVWPIKAFLDHGVFDLKAINALNNLRPCLGPENLSKADKYNEKEFVTWLSTPTKHSITSATSAAGC